MARRRRHHDRSCTDTPSASRSPPAYPAWPSEPSPPPPFSACADRCPRRRAGGRLRRRPRAPGALRPHRHSAGLRHHHRPERSASHRSRAGRCHLRSPPLRGRREHHLRSPQRRRRQPDEQRTGEMVHEDQATHRRFPARGRPRRGRDRLWRHGGKRGAAPAPAGAGTTRTAAARTRRAWRTVRPAPARTGWTRRTVWAATPRTAAAAGVLEPALEGEAEPELGPALVRKAGQRPAVGARQRPCDR